MPDTPTPGAICFAAYWENFGRGAGFAWDTMPPQEQAHWEAAAQAVLETADFPTLYERWRTHQEEER